MAALPRPDFSWIDPKTGKPTQVFLEFMQKFVGGNIGQLTNAANDAAAAALGVPIGNIYRNGSVVMIRVT